MADAATAPADFLVALAALASSPTSTRAAAYQEQLHALLRRPRRDVAPAALRAALAAFLDAAVFSDANSTGGGLVVGRQVLQAFDTALAGELSAPPRERKDDELGADDPAVWDEDLRTTLFEDAIAKVQPRVLSFEEQASSLRNHLADLYESAEDWAAAAAVLQGIPLDSGHRAVSDTTKLDVLVRIVRLLLEADDAVGADVSLKRASLVLHAVPGATPALPGVEQEGTPEERREGKKLGLMFKLCQARIYDAQRRFMEASTRYHELSFVPEIDEDERTQALSAAVTAAILSPAGPQRSRILATLIRDERTSSLDQHTILTKVFLGQIIRASEIASFEAMLAPHQKAELPPTANEKAMAAADAAAAAAAASSSDGDVEMGDSAPAAAPALRTQTVLSRAMIEHNVLAASTLYSNITFGGLALLLDLPAPAAESTVRRMVVQGRLKAELDQVGPGGGVVTFLTGGRGGAAEAGIAGGLSNEAGDEGEAQEDDDDPDAVWTQRWDQQIARTASSLEATSSYIKSLAAA